MKLVVENEVRDINYPEVKVLPIQEFFEMAECPVQRDTADRASKKKYKDKFSKLRPEHCTAVSCELTETCYYDGVEYNEGMWFLIDAHTRRWFWMHKLTDIIPTKIISFHYKCSSLEEVIKLYQHHDESTSVEQGVDKLFGACKLHGFTLEDKAFKVVMPFTCAAHYFDPIKYERLTGFSTLELKEVVSDLKEQMQVLQIFVSNPAGGLKKKGRKIKAFDFHAALIAGALLFLKAHDVTMKNADQHPAVEILKKINQGGKNTMPSDWDGVTHIVNEFDGSGDILPKNKKGTVLFTYNEIKMAISYVVYWLEKALNDTTQQQVGKNWATFIDGYYDKVRVTDNALSKALGI